MLRLEGKALGVTSEVEIPRETCFCLEVTVVLWRALLRETRVSAAFRSLLCSCLHSLEHPNCVCRSGLLKWPRVYSSEQRDRHPRGKGIYSPSQHCLQRRWPFWSLLHWELYVFQKKPFTSRPSRLCTLLHVIFSPRSFLLQGHLKWNICYVVLLLFLATLSFSLGNPVLLRYRAFELARPTSRSPVLSGCGVLKLGPVCCVRVITYSFIYFL